MIPRRFATNRGPAASEFTPDLDFRNARIGWVTARRLGCSFLGCYQFGSLPMRKRATPV